MTEAGNERVPARSVPGHLPGPAIWVPAPAKAAVSLFPADAARTMHMLVAGPIGSGKSRLVGRGIVRRDLLNGWPIIVIDPSGQITNNVLDFLSREDEQTQARLWPRIRYVDMHPARDAAGEASVTTFPFYYRRAAGEGLYEISQRVLDVVIRLDPHLATASVQGWPAVWMLGTAVGMILAAAGAQLSEAEDLIHHPERWAGRIDRALAAHPLEAERAVEWFRNYFLKLPPEKRLDEARSFLRKVAQCTWDLVPRAIYCADAPSLDLQEILDGRLCLLLDFRNVPDAGDAKALAILWLFRQLTEFFKARGPNRGVPLSFICDELSNLFATQAGAEFVADDLRQLTQVYGRNNRVAVTVVCQEVGFFDEGVQAMLLALGTQVIGGTRDPDAAMRIARLFHRYNPHLVKRYVNVWANVGFQMQVLERNPVEFTADEQFLLFAQRLLGLGKFRFLVAAAEQEGALPTSFREASIERLDAGVYPDLDWVDTLRAKLARRDGRKLSEVLAEIERRTAPTTTPPPPMSGATEPSLPRLSRKHRSAE